MTYMDLEKAYDRVDMNAVWRVLNMHGLKGMLLNVIRSFYEEIEACVKICRKESEWLGEQDGLHQSCVMSP